MVGCFVPASRVPFPGERAPDLPCDTPHPGLPPRSPPQLGHLGPVSQSKSSRNSLCTLPFPGIGTTELNPERARSQDPWGWVQHHTLPMQLGWSWGRSPQFS